MPLNLRDAQRVMSHLEHLHQYLSEARRAASEIAEIVRPPADGESLERVTVRRQSMSDEAVALLDRLLDTGALANLQTRLDPLIATLENKLARVRGGTWQEVQP